MTFISFAQNAEDVMLFRALKEVQQGRFIDIGANHPVEDSVTKAFYDRGWSGVNVEPVTQWFRLLNENRPRDTNFQLAISDLNQSLDFFEVAETGLSTLEAARAEECRQNGMQVYKNTVDVWTLEQLFETAQQTDTHFLKIDVEGAEAQVIKSGAWHKHRPWIVLVESTKPNTNISDHDAWEPVLLEHGYDFVWFDGINRFYVASERMAQLSHAFKFPINVLDDYIRYSEQQVRTAYNLLAHGFIKQPQSSEVIKLQQQVNSLTTAYESAMLSFHQAEQAHANAVAALGRIKRNPFVVAILSTRSLLVKAASLLKRATPRIVENHTEQEPVSDQHSESSAPSQPVAKGHDRTLFNSANTSRQTLAVVSPLPPAKTGIADYTAGLLPFLKEWFDIVLVVSDDFADSSGFNESYRLLTESEFLQRGDLHERVIYQLGNSPFHLGALQLLEQIPGVVVLHDICFGDVLQYQQEILGIPEIYYRALLESHGSEAIISLAQGSNCNAEYPASLNVIRNAKAIVVHSDYAASRMAKRYRAALKRLLYVVPHYKKHTISLNAQQRAEVLDGLGLGDKRLILATFGYCTPNKLLERIVLAWRDSYLVNKSDSVLVVVGEFINIHSGYEANIKSLCRDLGINNIQFTGYVDPEAYQRYLSITDIAIQLRSDSRGETSGAIMDCMSNEVALIANSVGSVAEFPDNAIWKIDQDANVSSLIAAVEVLSKNSALRKRIGSDAKEFIKQHCDPEVVSEQYKQIIEDTFKTAHEGGATLKNEAPLTLKQILIDVTAVVQHDLRTGIQRVVRSLLSEFYHLKPHEYRVEPVYLDQFNRYRYACDFVANQNGLPSLLKEDPVVEVSSGDIFFGVDMHTGSTVGASSIFESWRKSGVRIIFIIYDLLPIQRPDCFPAEVQPDFEAWLKTILEVSDGILAISRTVAEELNVWISEHRDQFSNPGSLTVGWFHLGADIAASLPSMGMPEDAAGVLDRLAAAPSFLMVATVEPRKGHRQVLAAFEALWRRGVNANLVIVGKHGWMVDPLAEKLLSHPEFGNRLFWLQGISDEYLEEIYPRCVALLAASEGEGFGLPIIEAAQHQLPVIARDIPVFREVGGSGVSYFADDRPEALADYLAGWLSLAEKPNLANVHFQTWSQSARQVLDFLLPEHH